MDDEKPSAPHGEPKPEAPAPAEAHPLADLAPSGDGDPPPAKRDTLHFEREADASEPDGPHGNEGQQSEADGE